MGENLFSFGNNKSANGVARIGKLISAPGGSAGSINIRSQAGAGAASTLSTSCIITSIKSNKNVAHQLTSTLGGELYINVFGDKPGQYFLEGIAFDSPKCESGARDPGKSIVEFYSEYKLRGREDDQQASTQIVTTVYNTLGNEPINYNGFLIGMVLDLSCNEEGVRQYRFSLMFVAVE